MDDKLVSIIILSYRNLRYLKETIDSTLNQEYKNIELILGDDGSDNFNCVEYENYINSNKRTNIKNVIVYKNESNIGIVKNLNKAIGLSKGKYIKWMAADDEFYDKYAIDKMINFAIEKDSTIVSTNIQICDCNMNEKNISKINIEKNRDLFENCYNSKKLLRKIIQKNFLKSMDYLMRNMFY